MNINTYIITFNDVSNLPVKTAVLDAVLLPEGFSKIIADSYGIPRQLPLGSYAVINTMSKSGTERMIKFVCSKNLSIEPEFKITLRDDYIF
ncbi:type V toxin-antitoxin system endoribonuclease antitoxin GhoS [Salmonella enterica]|uniref:Type V toxin-antitoxin system endoribonuclease antitoxin GhoS n=2 Tax=Salmonella enterica TaxID=28901 RepID=A0A603XGY5_SALER|nr:endoribonuclease GhoS [Salmonella enterica subsp. enterica serovar Java]EAN9729283.1 endoribonuclease GhoS [Salmonella enterica]EBV8394734.1 endoribonuclease GhoS [Salmonella enterica subsp. enterica serovar Virchow]EDQ0183613.1 type V toxin-antitoxin system endoribonuclease antitoxin GhoS [Salmonella enterica subsp. enterica serovar 4,[5],12:b:-]EDV9614009.1 type V toxin-antitoxin system endoribonuclease antitoxin GhoS [Salmonella enterica subsp. enterica serovar Paratyphi B]EEE5613237.1 t